MRFYRKILKKRLQLCITTMASNKLWNNSDWLVLRQSEHVFVDIGSLSSSVSFSDTSLTELTSSTAQSQWVTLSFCNIKVLHQTLNPTAELWCKTLSRIKVDLVLHRT